MDVLNNHLRTLNNRAVPSKTAVQDIPAKNTAGPFKSILDTAIYKETERVQFSKHANMRLNARQITLTGEQLSRVEEGVNKANAKGIRDSLVLVDNVALVVNVKSKTVITAIEQASENVYSNIDGAVIV
jgi:flagellar operon protein